MTESNKHLIATVKELMEKLKEMREDACVTVLLHSGNENVLFLKW